MKAETLRARFERLNRKRTKRTTVDGLECVQLKKKLRSKCYAFRKWKKCIPNVKENEDKGENVRRQIQHYFTCQQKKKCTCGLTRFVPSKYLKPLIDWLKENRIVIDDSELFIHHPNSQTVDWLHLIGHMEYDLESLVKISLHFGYSTHFNSDHQNLHMENLGAYRIPANTTNIHCLESVCQDVLLADMDLKPTKSFLLYATEPQPNEIKITKLDYPNVMREVRFRNTVRALLCK